MDHPIYRKDQASHLNLSVIDYSTAIENANALHKSPRPNQVIIDLLKLE